MVIFFIFYDEHGILLQDLFDTLCAHKTKLLMIRTKYRNQLRIKIPFIGSRKSVDMGYCVNFSMKVEFDRDMAISKWHEMVKNKVPNRLCTGTETFLITYNGDPNQYTDRYTDACV